MLAAPDEARADELLLNGGFEQGTEGWGATFGLLDVAETPVLEGARAGRLTSSALQSHEVYQFADVMSGEPYEFEGWVLSNDIAIVRIFLRLTWFDGFGNLISAADSPWLTGTASEYRGLTAGPVLSPGAAATVRMGILVQASAPFSLHLDDFSFTGAKPPPATS